MTISTLYTLNAVTVGATELSITNGTTSLATRTDNGIYGLRVSGASLAKGDYFYVRVYEKVISSGTKRVVFEATYSNATPGMLVLPELMLKHGWEMTIQKQAGTDRAFTAVVVGHTCVITEAYTQSALSVGITELSLSGGTSTIQNLSAGGKYQLFVDPVTNMAKADDFQINVREGVSVGAAAKFFSQNLMDVQGQNWVSPIFTLNTDFDFSMVKVTGTDRAFATSIRRVV